MVNKELKRRIIDIAYKYKLGHLGSYISCVDTIDLIFKIKRPNDIFILSNGHAALAQYVVLEKYHNHDAEELFAKLGGHPHLDEASHIYCSSGSLGMGLTVAIGRALANPNITVYVMLSDGECAEGVVWEGLRFIADFPVKNIKIFVIYNGFGAYSHIPVKSFQNRLSAFSNDNNVVIINSQAECEEFPFLNGLNAHYKIMTEKDYQTAINILT